jgi:nucleoside-diphosphate-sugar epimerase
VKILITGGAGFIASHVADRFLADGHAVFVLDNVVTGSRPRVFVEEGLACTVKWLQQVRQTGQ